MKALPKPAKLGLAVIALVVATVAGYKILIAPQRAEATRLAQQIEETRAEIAESQTTGPSTDLTPIRVADLFRLSRAMPDRPDVPNMLLELAAIAQETGISFESITPHDPEPLGTYRRLPVDLIFQGHFYDLSDFLYRMRNLVGVHDGELDAIGRLFSIDSIVFAEGDLKFPQVRATLTVTAFMFGDGTPRSASTDPTSTTPVIPSDVAPTDGGREPIPASPVSASAVETGT